MTYLVLQQLPDEIYKEIDRTEDAHDAEQVAIACVYQTHKRVYVAEIKDGYEMEEKAANPAGATKMCPPRPRRIHKEPA